VGSQGELHAMLNLLTIVLDGMPWIACHYGELRRLTIPWEWWIVEGVAAPTHCTSWCTQIPPRLSNDGTTEYLDSLRAADSRVKVLRSVMWDGKCAMLNHALSRMYHPGILLQVDSDELWTAEQLHKLNDLFEHHKDRNCAAFWCRYFVGRDLVITTRNTYGNNSSYEWRRAWRYQFGMNFKSHEPPVWNGPKPAWFSHADTERAGLVFDHMAYATEATLAFKAQYYKETYRNAVECWQKLQENRTFPTPLRQWFPWVTDNAMVNRIER